MHSTTVYMFCNHPFEIPCFAGITNVIRELRPDMKTTLILDSMPYFLKTEVDFALKYFDKVERIGWCDYYSTPLRPQAIPGIVKAFAATYRFYRQLRAIDIKPSSFVFMISGRQLVSNVLLKRLKGLNPTLIYMTTRHVESIENYLFSYKSSLYVNLYHLLFGASFVDYSYMRETGWVFIQHRKNPYHYTFFMRPPTENLATDEIPFPLYFPERQNHPSLSPGNIVVLFGSVFLSWKGIDREKFITRFNEIIDRIRIKHAGSRLIYKPHPRETNEKELLNLSGFEIDESATSELLFMREPSIRTAYSVASTSSRTALCFGIRSYLLFPLFDLPPIIQTRFEANCHYMPQETIIRSLDELSNSDDKTPPLDFTPTIRPSIVRILEQIGLLGK